VSIQIQQTGALKGQVPYTAWFFYGETGSGKTTAASSFPDPIFLVPSNENSFIALLDQERSFPYVILGKDMQTGQPLKVRQHVMEVLGWFEDMHREAVRLQNVAAALEAAGKAEEADAKYDEAARAFPYQSVVLESCTHLVDLVIEDITDYGRKPIDQRGWGLIQTFLRTVHDRLRALDVHIVYTALAQVKDVKGTESSQGSPNISGSMAQKMPSACDCIGYCEELNGPKGESIYRIHFRKFGPYPARARFRRMPKFVDGFKFEAVAEYLVSNEGE
jgi:hypothetical protein